MNTYTFTFNTEQLKTIDAALANLPYRDAAPLIAEMNRQIREAQESKEPPVASE